MIKNILVVILLFCFLYNASAQKTDAVSKWKFHSVNQVGLLQGESKSAFHLQSVNGLEKKNWFAGIGVGIDYYRYKSIPLFAEGIKYFGKTRNQFFIYADAGVNFIWEKTNKSTFYSEKYSPGFYWGSGIGYKAGLKNGTGFLISAAYSYKRVNDQQTQEEICPFAGPCNIQTDNYRYNLNRLLLQIGWMF
ncbi:MAG TPA: hypothetical protein VKI61_05805 [Chitinophagaceae bacterium]|jgi:hypothetical protein|nr:hypothetical protein [Chitinophagaceae bacterium]